MPDGGPRRDDDSRGVGGISAVIPTFDRGALVCRAIDSVLGQSVPPDEVIVIDDGSRDDTASRIAKYGDKVRYVAQENAGVSAARNHGVRLARGDWIAFLDADDLWEEGHLARMVAAIRATSGKPSLLFSDARFSDRPAGPTLWEWCGFSIPGTHMLAMDGAEWVSRPWQPMLIPGMVVRREDFLAVGGLREDLLCREDTHLIFRLSLGRAVCAVAGTGVDVTRDAAGDGRLTEVHSVDGEVYWACSVALYDDLARRPEQLDRNSRRLVRRRLGRAYWRSGRIAWREGRLLTAVGLLTRGVSRDPGLAPRRVLAGAHATLVRARRSAPRLR